MTETKLVTWWDEMPYDIAVVLPTRGRTDALQKSLCSLLDLAGDGTRVQYLIGMDDDDTETIKWAEETLFPSLEKYESPIHVFQFRRLGYERLNEYVTTLAQRSSANWIMFWNDDAIMHTQDWDKKIAAETGEFNVLRMPTHNEHPYAIFPIVPRDWLYLFGRLSPHQLSDAWISQVAFLINIMKNVDIEVTHARADITGENDDDTFKQRIMLEGNPDDPRDFNHTNWHNRRLDDAQKLAWFLHNKGRDMSWWRDVVEGTQDPWERMHNEFDPNNQVSRIKKDKDKKWVAEADNND